MTSFLCQYINFRGIGRLKYPSELFRQTAVNIICVQPACTDVAVPLFDASVPFIIGYVNVVKLVFYAVCIVKIPCKLTLAFCPEAPVKDNICPCFDYFKGLVIKVIFRPTDVIVQLFTSFITEKCKGYLISITALYSSRSFCA